MHAFEVEIVGRLVEQQKVGRCEQDRGQRHAHAPAAGELRAGPQLVRRPESPARPESRRRAQAPNRRRWPRAAYGFRRAGGDRSRFPPRPGVSSRSGSAASTVSSRLVGPAGTSCATAPMRQPLGLEISPPSGCSWPRISLNSVVLPAPLRPTSPIRRPGGQARAGAGEDFAAGDAVGDGVDREHGGGLLAQIAARVAHCRGTALL